MTALDSAGSLSDILDVLVDRAALHAGRVLLVVNRPDALTGWRWHGYTPDPRDASMPEIPRGRSRPGGPSGAIGCD